MLEGKIIKKSIISATICILALVVFLIAYQKVFNGQGLFLSQKTNDCIKCHIKKHVHTAQILEWKKSKHSQKSIGCYECHNANKRDPDAYMHYGSLISTIVSPKDCAQCHKKEYTEFNSSHHAKAGEILGSADNYLGEVVQGYGSSVQGCQSCHGSVVKINKDKKFDYKTWPNLGVGRLNPDGSKGSCSSCHSKHAFSLEVARSPESCGKCHLGPDHPQKEIYEESIHGRIYFVKVSEMNLNNSVWVLGKDYSAAPDCITCHMGATKQLLPTHDIGTRLSWNLRLAVSKPMENSKEKRARMKLVCSNCHSPQWISNYYKQLDDTVNLYNNTYAKPAKEVIDLLRSKGKLTKAPFDEDIEWVYFELWHHEGRRARHGAAMMGPDYVQWIGFYNLAHKFYFEFLPLARKMGEEEYVNKLLSRPEHAWFKGINPKNLKQQEQAFAKWAELRQRVMNGNTK